jgi:hypothetical protein
MKKTVVALLSAAAVGLAVGGGVGWVACRAMSKAGNGARGIVYVGTGKPGSVGHVFNVVNQKGVVRFLDGQTGKAVQWQKDWTDVRLLRMN